MMFTAVVGRPAPSAPRMEHGRNTDKTGNSISEQRLSALLPRANLFMAEAQAGGGHLATLVLVFDDDSLEQSGEGRRIEAG